MVIVDERSNNWFCILDFVNDLFVIVSVIDLKHAINFSFQVDTLAVKPENFLIPYFVIMKQ
jgi:hypothetical protein